MSKVKSKVVLVPRYKNPEERRRWTKREFGASGFGV